MSRSGIYRLLDIAVVVGVLAALTPAAHGVSAAQAGPPPRILMGMTYDSARGQTVLFGGSSDTELRDTWTWDGSVWTKRAPVHSPSRRAIPAMAYDAARSQAVLFGGYDRTHGQVLIDTWTWDGTDWTKQNPAHVPPERRYAGIAYDAGRSQVVLYGGVDKHGRRYGDTWTWNGTDWKKRNPAHSPGTRYGAAMAFDAARSQVVLFGGDVGLDDTWTWDGTDWTERTPAHIPPFRERHAMAYDATSAQVVLFGGEQFGSILLGDTWTWDGTDWTERTPAHSPSPRYFFGTADDSGQGQVVLFGGADGGALLGDTWTWNGGDWSLGTAGSLDLAPPSGPPGTAVQAGGSGFAAGEVVKLKFLDSVHGTIPLGKATTDASGAFTLQVSVPLNATPGTQRIKAKGSTSGEIASRRFTVT